MMVMVPEGRMFERYPAMTIWFPLPGLIAELAWHELAEVNVPPLSVPASKVVAPLIGRMQTAAYIPVEELKLKVCPVPTVGEVQYAI